MTKEKIQEFTFRITKANKTEMIAILYDMALTYLEDAGAFLISGECALFRNEISRAKSVVKELMNSVNTSADMGMNFLSIYIYCESELTKAYLDFCPENIENVSKIFRSLKEAYDLLGKKDSSGAVMGNTEKIYSGLTYNRSLMNENVSDATSNRGFLA